MCRAVDLKTHPRWRTEGGKQNDKWPGGRLLSLLDALRPEVVVPVVEFGIIDNESHIVRMGKAIPKCTRTED